ncbi:MAG: hypothetical protein RSF88_02215 [Lachnospiraceae bacterium]
MCERIYSSTFQVVSGTGRNRKFSGIQEPVSVQAREFTESYNHLDFELKNVGKCGKHNTMTQIKRGKTQ